MLITPQLAREYAARSVAKRRQRRIERENIIASPPSEAVLYVETRLARVRRQLDLIDHMIEHERDPQKLDRLASAQARLSDQEFALANRPKPGPTKSLPPRRRPSAGADPGSPDLV